MLGRVSFLSQVAIFHARTIDHEDLFSLVVLNPSGLFQLPSFSLFMQVHATTRGCGSLTMT